MRRWSWGLLALLVLAAPVRAAQPRCPLPLGECMAQFGAMRDRPWLGVEVETDSVTGARVVHAVVPGGPAARAGVKPGDTLRKLNAIPVTSFGDCEYALHRQSVQWICALRVVNRLARLSEYIVRKGIARMDLNGKWLVCEDQLK